MFEILSQRQQTSKKHMKDTGILFNENEMRVLSSV